MSERIYRMGIQHFEAKCRLPSTYSGHLWLGYHVSRACPKKNLQSRKPFTGTVTGISFARYLLLPASWATSVANKTITWSILLAVQSKHQTFKICSSWPERIGLLAWPGFSSAIIQTCIALKFKVEIIQVFGFILYEHVHIIVRGTSVHWDDPFLNGQLGTTMTVIWTICPAEDSNPLVLCRVIAPVLSSTNVQSQRNVVPCHIEIHIHECVIFSKINDLFVYNNYN